MKIPPFDAHRHDESNELLSIPLRSIESETSWHFDRSVLIKLFIILFYIVLHSVLSKINCCMLKCQGVSLSIGRRRTNNSSLDSSWRCASNGSIFISLASIDGKLFTFYALETFANNFLSIDARDMKIPPFDAHRHDESNEL